VEEKRAFMRIPTRLRGYLRLLADPDELPLFRETPPLGAGSGQPDNRDPGMSEALYAMLCTLNAKLDMILSMHSREQIENDFPVPMDIIEISGAGVRFTTPTPVPVERHVETVIVLSRFPLRMAGAVGRILRQENRDDQAVYALDFTRIRERDLEHIVQFVFQSQRDDLRGNKWD